MGNVFQNLEKELRGEKVEPIDFYSFEDAWNKSIDTFPVSPLESPIEIVKELHEKLITENSN